MLRQPLLPLLPCLGEQVDTRAPHSLFSAWHLTSWPRTTTDPTEAGRGCVVTAAKTARPETPAPAKGALESRELFSSQQPGSSSEPAASPQPLPPLTLSSLVTHG